MRVSPDHDVEAVCVNSISMTGSKAESAEKKLAKMSQEHKGHHEQTDLLTRLREEMKSLDLEIMTEETRIGDFKRLSSKELLALKFGSLLEFAEKASVGTA